VFTCACLCFWSTIKNYFVGILAINLSKTLQMTSFANRQPDPAFQVSETPIFTLTFAKPL
jgi:hypothetical protein